MELSERIVEVLRDQAERGQVRILSENQGRSKFPHFVTVSLSTLRKDKPNGVITARVLFDETHGI